MDIVTSHIFLLILDVVLFVLLRVLRPVELKDKGIASVIGGVVVFINLTFSALMFEDNHALLVFAFLMIFFLGLYDDNYGANAPLKLFLQIVAAYLVALQLHLPTAYALVAACMIALTSNMYNITDGIDGVCAIMSATALAGLTLLDTDAVHYSKVNTYVILSLLVFLVFNFQPTRRIILGDTGSLLLGFLIGYKVVAVLFVDQNYDHLLYLSVLFAYPVADTVFAIVRRAIRKRHLLKGDYCHFHHLLSFLLKSDHKAAILLGIAQLLFLASVFLLMQSKMIWIPITIFGLVVIFVSAYGMIVYRQFRLVHGEGVRV